MFIREQSTLRKIFNIICFLLFTLFAVVQLNDPDPILWVVIYLSVGIVCLISNHILIPKVLISLFVIGLAIYAAMHFNLFLDWLYTENKSEIFGEMIYEKPYLEASREFIGLCLAILALLTRFLKK